MSDMRRIRQPMGDPFDKDRTQNITLAEIREAMNRVWATRDSCDEHYPRYCPPDCENAGKHDEGLGDACECHQCR